ncbi:MAG TPA: YciI family protein [Planctomycetota bacterium]|nr:YciI family protein [Planctomycetota bacterium]
MLILRSDPSGYANLSPQEMQDLLERFEAWGAKMAAQNRIRDGKKLTDSGGKVLTLTDGRLQVKDGPFGETKEIVGGVYFITADSYDHAVELCRDQPNLRLKGASIEIRAVDWMGQEPPAE